MNTFYNTSSAGFVYLVWAIGTPRYKIGKSKDPSARVEQLSAQSCYPLKLIESCFFTNYEYHEKRLHKLAAKWRVHGEWFELPDFMVKNVPAWFHNAQCTYIEKSKKQEIVIINNTENGFDKIQEISTIRLRNKIELFEEFPVETLTDLDDSKLIRAINLLGSFAEIGKFKSKTTLELESIIGAVPPNVVIAAKWKSQIKKFLRQK